MPIPAGGRPEDRARANIDRLLTAAGWLIQNRDSINIEAGRGVAFHRLETLAAWLESDLKSPGSTLRGRLRIMPPLPREGLWDHQRRVIVNLEQSLARNDPRALIHMTMRKNLNRLQLRLASHRPRRRLSRSLPDAFPSVIRDRSRNPQLLTAHV